MGENICHMPENNNIYIYGQLFTEPPWMFVASATQAMCKYLTPNMYIF
jgi:hypothetical protein